MFAECEAVVLRLVHKKTWHIIELVIHLRLYAESLNGEAIAAHILESIAEYDLDVKNWRCTMLDRASTNKGSLNLICEKKGVKPLAAFCISHGYSGCGKKHEMTIGKRVLKNFTKMVQHQMCKGKFICNHYYCLIIIIVLNIINVSLARNLHSSVYGESPKKGGGVRWGIELEHAAQVNRLGVEDMMEKYVRPCFNNDWSKKSSGKQITALKNPQDMAKSIVELASLVDVGTPLIKRCYNCESKQPMVFVVGEVVQEMNEMYGLGPEHYPNFDELDKKSQAAADIVAKEVAPLVEAVDDAKSALDGAKSAESDASSALLEFKSQNAASSSSLTRNRRTNSTLSSLSYRTMANPASRPSAQNQQHKALQDTLHAAKDLVKEKDSLHRSAIDGLSEFKEGKLITKDDFRNHGIKVVRPIFKDYIRLFLSPNGDFKNLSSAYYAARVMNPLVAAKMSVAGIEAAVKGLKEFGFDEFRDGGGIIDNMIEQIPSYLAKVDRTGVDFWNSVEGAKEYDDKLAKKAVKDAAKYGNKTWKDDPIEQARRVWEWWRANRSSPGIHFFATAARLLALVQVSSVSVERIFSQVKLICETTGVQPLEETVEVRLFERCNTYLVE